MEVFAQEVLNWFRRCRPRCCGCNIRGGGGGGGGRNNLRKRRPSIHLNIMSHYMKQLLQGI